MNSKREPMKKTSKCYNCNKKARTESSRFGSFFCSDKCAIVYINAATCKGYEKTKNRIFIKGDVIGYTRAFCQSTGCLPTSDIWHKKGIFNTIEGNFAQIWWHGDFFPTLVNIKNIAKVGSAAFAHSETQGWVGYAPNQKSPWKKSVSF